MNENKYYTLVTDRISEVEKELKRIESELSKEENSIIREVLELEREVVNEKLKYLHDIELMPLYVSISSLSQAQIFELETKKHISYSDLQHKLGLDRVKNVLSRSKVTTLGYLKELFINDYSSMYDLISLQSINFMCNDRIQSLYNKGENSIAQILIRERKLRKLEINTEEVIRDLEMDYDFDTLKEINYYKKNNEETLPYEFILKHKDKVTHKDSKMRKVIKKLNRKEKFKFITKFFKTKRNKEEVMFLNSVMDFYNNDSRLSSLGLSSSKNLLDNSYTIKKFIKTLNKKVSSKKRELKDIKESLNSIKSSTLSEIKKYENLKEQKKNDFITLLKSKTDFLPKIFSEQLWNEPELKSSLIRVVCIDEEKKLFDKISNWSAPITENTLSQYETDKQIHLSVKKLTA